MPTMANITVKKADNTTDITYTALAGSSGEGVPAQWRHEDAAIPAAFRASLKLTAKGGNTGKRTVDALFVRPITQTTDGVTKQIGTHTVRMTGSLAMTDDQSVIDEAVAQAINLFDSSLVVSAFKEGYAPRG